MRRASALLMALWIILTLSVIVLSFSFEAHLQGGVNVYTQSKNRVKRLIESGRVIGEVILLDYENAEKTYEQDEVDEKLEKDRWFVEKRDLRFGSGCVIGPIRLDEDDPDSGTVRIEITCDSADSSNGININSLERDHDPNYEDRWRVILNQCGVPTDEVRDADGESYNLQAYIIACWQDFRDSDAEKTVINEKTNFRGVTGAEESEYSDYYKEHEKDVAEEDRLGPANGPIGDLKELSRLLCFRKFPAVLTGGPLFPLKDGEKPKKDDIVIRRGLVNLGVLGVEGDGKINVNRCTQAQLMTVPGIFDPDELDEGSSFASSELAEAIVKCRTIAPTRYDLPDDPTITEWGYGVYSTDQSDEAWWSDLTQRVADEFDLEIPGEAKEYLTAQPPSSKAVLFKMKITASLMSLDYQAECECYVKDKKIRYVSWKED